MRVLNEKCDCGRHQKHETDGIENAIEQLGSNLLTVACIPLNPELIQAIKPTFSFQEQKNVTAN